MTRKNKKRILIDLVIGFIVGGITNALGVFLWWLLFSKNDLEVFLQMAYEEGHLGTIISIAALLSLGAFFLFLKRSFDTRARGVLLWVFVVAFIIFYLEFF